MRCRGDEAKARAAGCDDYVTKPYSPRQLLAKMRRVSCPISVMHSRRASSSSTTTQTNRRHPADAARRARLRARAGRRRRGGARRRREHLPDLILLDIMMPKIDGIEVVQADQGRRDPAVHADHPGHRQGRHQGRGRRARSGRRRISDQADRPDGAGGAGANRCCASRRCTTRCRRSPPNWRA